MSDWVTVAKRAPKKKQITQAERQANVREALVSQVDGALLLVVDTAPLIKGLQLGNDHVALWSISEVMAEVRDKRARKNLDQLPHEIKLREPSAEHLKAGKSVLDFVSICAIFVVIGTLY